MVSVASRRGREEDLLAYLQRERIRICKVELEDTAVVFAGLDCNAVDGDLARTYVAVVSLAVSVYSNIDHFSLLE